MVRNAILTVSASQIRANQKIMAVKSLEYRSAALRGLQRASHQPPMDARSALLTLATILGLLIDDMVNESRDFSALVKLADSWNIMNCTDNGRSNEPLRQFMLDQIQMYSFVSFGLSSTSPSNAN